MNNQIAKHKKLWKAANSFNDLCGLTAKWLSGEILFTPTNCASGVDDESYPIIEYLIQFNLNGFMTIVSQPQLKEKHWQQRAFVDGFALESTAGILGRLEFQDLFVDPFPPGTIGERAVPVTINGGKESAWAGKSGFQEIEHFVETCGKSAIKKLRKAWYVSIIDLDWDRKDHLWKTVSEALHGNL